MICRPVFTKLNEICGLPDILRITRFVILVIRPDYQKFCLRSTTAMHLHVIIHFSEIPECKLTHEICLMALRCIPLFLRDTDIDVYFYFAGRPLSFRFTDQNSFQISFDLVMPISMYEICK